MNKANILCASMILLVSCSVVWADLSSEFTGYTTVSEVGMSGLQSSYYADTKTGVTLPDYMFSLGPERVSYPHGVGQVPSPGGNVGRVFDESVIGLRVEGGNLMIQVAGGWNPLQGYYYSGWDTWYSQGDVFITVEDTAGISRFALLNSWPSDGTSYRTLNGGHFDVAQAFHTGAGGGTDLQGHLVGLCSTDDVVLAGGRGSYHPDYSPRRRVWITVSMHRGARILAMPGCNILPSGTLAWVGRSRTGLSRHGRFPLTGCRPILCSQ